MLHEVVLATQRLPLLGAQGAALLAEGPKLAPILLQRLLVPFEGLALLPQGPDFLRRRRLCRPCLLGGRGHPGGIRRLLSGRLQPGRQIIDEALRLGRGRCLRGSTAAGLDKILSQQVGLLLQPFDLGIALLEAPAGLTSQSLRLGGAPCEHHIVCFQFRDAGLGSLRALTGNGELCLELFTLGGEFAHALAEALELGLEPFLRLAGLRVALRRLLSEPLCERGHLRFQAGSLHFQLADLCLEALLLACEGLGMGMCRSEGSLDALTCSRLLG
mmetsp:Transcript_32091/g.68395  ORF Transcript_32091/g.68395 Transcript_32091/m.68395 type:complete len:273 (-) Transcript_32091:1001-1819(-)